MHNHKRNPFAAPTLMGTLWTLRSARITALVCCLVGMLWLVLARGLPVQAGGVVGSGTPGSCTESTLDAKLAGGGSVTFSCGAAPVTITVLSTKDFVANTTIDGGGLVTISGGDAVRVLKVEAGVTLQLNNLTVSSGFIANDYGGGVRNSGVLIVNNSRIVNSQTTGSTCCSGGGGISSEGMLTVTNSVISGNASSLGGGINSNGPMAIVNSQIWGNTAGEAGGGVFNYIGGKASISGGAIFGNMTTFTTTGGGAGIYSVDTFSLDHVDVSGNRSAAGSNSAGGGILNTAGGTLTVTSSTLSGNVAGGGGGIQNDGAATLTNSVLSGNMAVQGGTGTGGGLYNSGTATLNNSTFKGNSAESAGGIDNDGTVTLTNSTFSGNSADYGGGGIRSWGTATLNTSTLSGNSADYGGGILVVAGMFNVHNSTVSGNSVVQQGGGIFVTDNGTAALWNATLSDNSAGSGGALYMMSGASTFVTNTIIAYSHGSSNCSGGITLAISSIASDFSCGPLFDIDPLLTALGNYGGPTQVHMLKLGSPAIDGVAGTPAPPSDQRGLARSTDGRYDIGAVEQQSGESDLAPRLYLPVIVR